MSSLRFHITGNQNGPVHHHHWQVQRIPQTAPWAWYNRVVDDVVRKDIRYDALIGLPCIVQFLFLIFTKLACISNGHKLFYWLIIVWEFPILTHNYNCICTHATFYLPLSSFQIWYNFSLFTFRYYQATGDILFLIKRYLFVHENVF